MKKLITFLTMVLIIVSTQPVFAEDTEIEGLHENWSKLFMTNYFTEEELAQIDNDYMTSTEQWLREIHLPQKQSLHKMETNSFENEVVLELERAKLNYANAVRVSLLYSNKYAAEYAQAGKFSYLFSEKEYWSAPDCTIYSDKGRFTIDGTYIEDISEWVGYVYPGFTMPTTNILNNITEEKLREYLLAKNEYQVSDIKIFPMSSRLTFLFVECNEKEYVMLLDEPNSKDIIANIEVNTLYNTDEMMNALIDGESNGWVYWQWVADEAAKTKPTYQAEAEALQAEGLLYGNENGLDLLKPLSRIETAAMLLRALGESEDADTSSAQVFTDVAPNHWGYGAAQNAYSLGLIYGVGDNLFAPDKKVTATEFSSMVLRAIGENDFDWQSATDILIERGILTAEQAETMDLFTRGDMAKIIYEVRNRGLL